MSRRSLQWKRAIAQAGGDVNKIIPQNATGRAKRGTGVPKELLGELGKATVGKGKGNTCTVGMNTETESRLRALAKK